MRLLNLISSCLFLCGCSLDASLVTNSLLDQVQSPVVKVPLVGMLDQSLNDLNLHKQFSIDANPDERHLKTFETSDGNYLIVAVANERIVLYKMSKAGSIVTSFGQQGYVALPTERVPHNNGTNYYSKDVYQDINGDFLLGFYSDKHNDKAMFLYKFTEQGALIPSFGVGGELKMPTASDQGVTAIATDSSQRIFMQISNNSSLGIYRFTANGQLDTSFNSTGYKNFGSVFSMGRFLLDGTQIFLPVGNEVWNLDLDGNLNFSFGTSGKTVMPVIGVAQGAISSLSMTASGKILAFGVVLPTVSASDAIIYRLNVNGSLDTSFNGSGYLTSDSGLGSGSSEYRKDVLVTADETIFYMLSTSSGENDTYQAGYAIWKVSSAGVLLQPVVTRPRADNKGNIYSNANLLLEQNNLMIFDIGTDVVPSRMGDSYFYDLQATRLNLDLSLDTTFQSSGTVKVNQKVLTSAYLYSSKVLTDSQSRIYTLSHINLSAEGSLAIVTRYKSDGTVDSDYADAGHLIVAGVFSSSILLDKLNRLYLSGAYLDGGQGRLVSLRYTSAGQLDSSFSNSSSVSLGSVHVHLFQNVSTAANPLQFASSWDSKGRQVVSLVTATTEQFSEDGDTWEEDMAHISVIRFLASGLVDTGFATNGVYSSGFVYNVENLFGQDGFFDVIIQSDDSIVAVGDFAETSTFSRSLSLFKLTPQGALDTSFAVNGMWTTEGLIGQPDESPLKVFKSGNDLLIFSYHLVAGELEGFKIRKLNQQGVLDSSYGNAGIALLQSSPATTGFSALTGAGFENENQEFVFFAPLYKYSGSSGVGMFKVSAQGQVDPMVVIKEENQNLAAYGVNVTQDPRGSAVLYISNGYDIDDESINEFLIRVK